jgi:hypothetical protein
MHATVLDVQHAVCVCDSMSLASHKAHDNCFCFRTATSSNFRRTGGAHPPVHPDNAAATFQDLHFNNICTYTYTHACYDGHICTYVNRFSAISIIRITPCPFDFISTARESPTCAIQTSRSVTTATTPVQLQDTKDAST